MQAKKLKNLTSAIPVELTQEPPKYYSQEDESSKYYAPESKPSSNYYLQQTYEPTSNSYYPEAQEAYESSASSSQPQEESESSASSGHPQEESETSSNTLTEITTVSQLMDSISETVSQLMDRVVQLEAEAYLSNKSKVRRKWIANCEFCRFIIVDKISMI